MGEEQNQPFHRSFNASLMGDFQRPRVTSECHRTGQHPESMTAYRIDPVHDPRWPLFLGRHSRATVFHTPDWLEALRRTYGYEPLALTTCAPDDELSNGLVFCRIRSWLTGRRLVSLPFSDHCEPLVENEEELKCLLSALKRELDASRSRYAEIRPMTLPTGVPPGLEKAASFWMHRLDLRPSLEELFRGFHRDCVQRRIRRAEREALAYEEGRSEPLLQRFYQLLTLTRRRQQLPPQPLAWFRTLIGCMGDKLEIRLACKDGHPVASILTLRYKNTLVYKYGCSDAGFNNLGGTQLLFWRAIQKAKHEGLQTLDLGRSDPDNTGLITFKDRWGGKRFPLTYYRLYPAARCAPNYVLSAARDQTSAATWVLSHLPDRVLIAAGTLFYRHMG